jgi:intracellular septation protein
MSPQTRRMLLDFGPLVLFFAAFRIWGLYAATGVVMASAVASLALGYWFDRKLHPVPLVTAVLVLVFGGLTLYLNNPIFIKMKPTFVYALLGAALIGGLVFKLSLVKQVLSMAVTLDEAAWRVLSLRFAFFFFAMAIINELIWRNFSNEIWVDYHVFGALMLTFLFGLSQTPFLLKHQIETGDGE